MYVKSSFSLSEFYKTIIEDELNIKAVEFTDSISEFITPGGRLYEQRNRAWELINDIPGVSCVKPRGALYMFPKIDAKRFNIHDDQKMVLDFLLQEKVLLVQGTAFNWPWPDHFRIVTLPRVDDIELSLSKFARFLSGYHQL